VDLLWIVLICIVAAVTLIVLVRWLLAGGRRRDPGRVMPDPDESRPTPPS
jgi:hypothetical protein